MSQDAKSGNEILELVMTHAQKGRYYTAAEIYQLLCDEGCLSKADLEHNESGEAKAYRRLHNALRDGAVTGVIQKNEDSSPFQYRVAP